MVHVSKKYLEAELKKSAWKNFRKAIKDSGSNEAFLVNLKKFLTPTEIIMLEKRLAIPVLLERGLSYRSIGEIIDVSPNTISFVKNNLTKKPAVRRRSSGKKADKSDMEHLISWFPSRSDHGRWLRKN
ncbi:hypothetical protein D4R51_03530 [bacterium]|nr:MAG: hypothetical protein D4R51_03530 [bacterium]